VDGWTGMANKYLHPTVLAIATDLCYILEGFEIEMHVISLTGERFEVHIYRNT
jgi:hypothetical protein